MRKLNLAAAILAAPLVFGGFAVAIAQDAPPFGGPDDVAFANALWQEMAAARLVGPDAIQTTTYVGGTGLHTETLVTVQSNIALNDSTGLAIVKKNFRTPDDTAALEEDVFAGNAGGPVTVMYQREVGYDTDNQDWFWAVFTPAGDVVVNPLGLNMAGKIVGGGAMADAPFNCVACHTAAPGDDLVFLHDAVPAR